MIHSWFVIANPISGNKKISDTWKEIEQLLNEKNIDFSYAFTAYSKHEIELVQNAIQKGYRKIISVGGDGTLHHVVNGIMTQRYVKTSDITVGVIPLGTGNDWIKTYNIPNNIKLAIDLIYQRKTILQDIGYLELTNTTAYFNNVAGIGYDGYVVNKLNKLKKFGPLAYLLSGISGLLFYEKTSFTIEVNNTQDIQLRAGLFAEVNFDALKTNDTEAKFIPREAIVGSLQNPSVYIVKDSTVTLQKIKVGAVINGDVAVLDGLQNGQQVVTKGIINLTDGTKVKITNN